MDQPGVVVDFKYLGSQFAAPRPVVVELRCSAGVVAKHHSTAPGRCVVDPQRIVKSVWNEDVVFDEHELIRSKVERLLIGEIAGEVGATESALVA